VEKNEEKYFSELLGRENDQSHVIGVSTYSMRMMPRSVVYAAISRASMDFMARRFDENGVLINEHHPLGSTIDRISNLFDAGRIRPASFQHAFVSFYMKNDREFPDRVVESLEIANHENYKDTGTLMQKAIAIPGGISIALYPDDVPADIERAAWKSKFAGDAFQFVTDKDLTSYRTPPYIKSIYSKNVNGKKEEMFDSIRGLYRLKNVLANVNNPVILKTVIKQSIIESKERSRAAKFDFDRSAEKSMLDAIGRVAFRNNRLAVRKAILDIIDHDEFQTGRNQYGVGNYSYFNTIPAKLTCDFLKRSSVGHDSKDIKDKELLGFKKAARKLLVRRRCIKYER